MIASFHLVHFRLRSVPSMFARVELDRLALPNVDGLRFGRLLVSTPGPPERPMAPPTPHLSRSALFAVWEDEGALDRFVSTSPVAKRWRAHAREAWHVRLQPLHSHGTCLGVNPLAGTENAQADAAPGAMLTHINLRLPKAAAFYRTFPHVAAEMRRHPGFRAGIFMSEAPPHTYVRNYTFSLWSSLAQAMDYAYQGGPASAHGDAMERSLGEGWHHEFMWARFRPFASAGTWNGRDPLAALAGPTSS